jgi:hypothetical protein
VNALLVKLGDEKVLVRDGFRPEFSVVKGCVSQHNKEFFAKVSETRVGLVPFHHVSEIVLKRCAHENGLGVGNDSYEFSAFFESVLDCSDATLEKLLVFKNVMKRKVVTHHVVFFVRGALDNVTVIKRGYKFHF